MNNILKRISEQLYDQAIGISSQEAFVKDRIFKTQNYSVFQNLQKGGSLYIHIVPQESITFNDVVQDRHTIAYADDLLHPLSSTAGETIITSEGIARIHEVDRVIKSYTQYLYCGAVELFTTPFYDEVKGINVFSDGDFTGKLVRSLVKVTDFLISQNFKFPMNMYVNFIDCRGVSICPSQIRKTIVESLSMPVVTLNNNQDIYHDPGFTNLMQKTYFIFGRYE